MKRVWYVLSGERRANRMVAKALSDYRAYVVGRAIGKILAEEFAKYFAKLYVAKYLTRTGPPKGG